MTMMTMMTAKNRLDVEYLWKRWRDDAGAKLEEATLRRIISAISGLDVEKTLSVVGAIRDAMLNSWAAGWAAAEGGENGERELILEPLGQGSTCQTAGRQP